MKWVLLLLVVGGLVLASGPTLAQDAQPSQLHQLYYQELAKYHHMVSEYNSLVEAYQSAGEGGPNFPGARRLIAQISAQYRKVQGLKKALEALEQQQ